MSCLKAEPMLALTNFMVEKVQSCSLVVVKPIWSDFMVVEEPA